MVKIRGTTWRRVWIKSHKVRGYWKKIKVNVWVNFGKRKKMEGKE